MYLFKVENQKLQPRDKKNPRAEFFNFDTAVAKLPSHDAAFLKNNKSLIKSYLK